MSYYIVTMADGEEVRIDATILGRGLSEAEAREEADDGREIVSVRYVSTSARERATRAGLHNARLHRGGGA